MEIKDIVVTRGMSVEMMLLAIKLINEKYKVESYYEYPTLILKEFKCRVTLTEVMKVFDVGSSIDDFILNRKQCGYGY
jgi:hypothetical protein|tara:strand:+ start:44 stop:277 length:234 start_codon:yes stop_codon:yes gene_type:complete